MIIRIAAIWPNGGQGLFAHGPPIPRRIFGKGRPDALRRRPPESRLPLLLEPESLRSHRAFSLVEPVAFGGALRLLSLMTETYGDQPRPIPTRYLLRKWGRSRRSHRYICLVAACRPVAGSCST